MLHTYLARGFFWYASDTLLFWLESTNPKKKFPDPECFSIIRTVYLFGTESSICMGPKRSVPKRPGALFQLHIARKVLKIGMWNFDASLKLYY